MRMAFAALAYTQSCLNPIVYAFVSKGFRQSFVDAVTHWCHAKRHGSHAAYNAVIARRNGHCVDVRRDTLQCSTRVTVSHSTTIRRYEVEGGRRKVSTVDAAMVGHRTPYDLQIRTPVHSPTQSHDSLKVPNSTNTSGTPRSAKSTGKEVYFSLASTDDKM